MTTATTHWSDMLRALDACQDAVAWARTQPDLATAWQQCERADWLLWYAGRVSGPVGSASRKRLVLAACACARTALPVWEQRYPDDLRPRQAIEVAERYARDEAGVTLDDVRRAAHAAYTAYIYSATYTDSAAHAAYAAYGTYTAAADAATYSAEAAAYADARPQALREMADLVRQHYPTPPSTPSRGTMSTPQWKRLDYAYDALVNADGKIIGRVVVECHAWAASTEVRPLGSYFTEEQAKRAVEAALMLAPTPAERE